MKLVKYHFYYKDSICSSFYSPFYLTTTRYLNITPPFYLSVPWMPITFERAVFKSGDSYRVTIPMEIIRALNIKEKEKLRIWLDNSHIIIEKMTA
jgi:hypothetical protein